MGLLASHSHPSLRHPLLPHGGAGDGPGGGGGDAAGSEDAGGSAPPEPQAAGEQGLPTGSGLCGLGQWVPLPSAQGEMGAAVCGGHLSRQRKGRRRFSIEHFFKAMNSEFSGRFGQRTPLGVHRFLVLCFLTYLLAHGAGGGGADLAGGGQGVPAPALAQTCSSGGTGGTSCPRPLAPTAG